MKLKNIVSCALSIAMFASMGLSSFALENGASARGAQCLRCDGVLSMFTNQRAEPVQPMICTSDGMAYCELILERTYSCSSCWYTELISSTPTGRYVYRPELGGCVS